MITVRRSTERHHDRRRRQEVWHSFHALAAPDGFGTLQFLDETRIPPGAGVQGLAGHDSEVVTFVHEGSLAFVDASGRSGVIQPGEFQRTTNGRDIHYRERNASRADWAHVFQIGLCPSQAGLEPGREQKRFSAAQRRGELCVVAAPDGRKGALHIHQDALVYSAILDPGNHVVHELLQGRRAWLQLVEGEVTLGDVVLSTGDGAGLTSERAVSITAREETELLLFDLGEKAPTPERSAATAAALD